MKKVNVLSVLAVAGSFCIASCSQDEAFTQQTTPAGTGEIGQYQFNLLSAVGAAESSQITSLHSYVFSEGTYLKKFENIDVSTGKFQFSLPADKQKKLFFLANHAPLTMDEGTFSETSLLELVSNSAVSTPPAVFLSGLALAGTATHETVDLTLVRGVVRIDINPGTETNLSVDSVKYVGGADRTFLFSEAPGRIPAEAAEVTYLKKFDIPLTGSAEAIGSEVFYVYENGSKAADITVYGKYNGVPVEVAAKAPANMSRNHIYTIKLSGVGQTIVGTIEVKDWEKGDDIVATPNIP